MKRGRRLTKPQLIPAKVVRRLTEIENNLRLQCFISGHQFEPVLGCCRRCGEATPQRVILTGKAWTESPKPTIKIEASLDGKNWQEIHLGILDK